MTKLLSPKVQNKINRVIGGLKLVYPISFCVMNGYEIQISYYERTS